MEIERLVPTNLTFPEDLSSRALHGYLTSLASDYIELAQDKSEEADLLLTTRILNIKTPQILYALSQLDILKDIERISPEVGERIEKLLNYHSYEIERFEEQLGALFFGLKLNKSDFENLFNVCWFNVYACKVLWRFSVDNEEHTRFLARPEGNYENSKFENIQIPDEAMITIVPFDQGEWRSFSIRHTKYNSTDAFTVDDEDRTIRLNRKDGDIDIIELIEERMMESDEAQDWKSTLYTDLNMSQSLKIVDNPIHKIKLAESTNDQFIIKLLHSDQNQEVLGALANNIHTPDWMIKQLIEVYLHQDPCNENWMVCSGLAKNPKVPTLFPDDFDSLVYYPHIIVKESAASNINIQEESHLRFFFTIHSDISYMHSLGRNAASNPSLGRLITQDAELMSIIMMRKISGGATIYNFSLSIETLEIILSNIKNLIQAMDNMDQSEFTTDQKTDHRYDRENLNNIIMSLPKVIRLRKKLADKDFSPNNLNTEDIYHYVKSSHVSPDLLMDLYHNGSYNLAVNEISDEMESNLLSHNFINHPQSPSILTNSIVSEMQVPRQFGDVYHMSREKLNQFLESMYKLLDDPAKRVIYDEYSDHYVILENPNLTLYEIFALAKDLINLGVNSNSKALERWLSALCHNEVFPFEMITPIYTCGVKLWANSMFRNVSETRSKIIRQEMIKTQNYLVLKEALQSSFITDREVQDIVYSIIEMINDNQVSDAEVIELIEAASKSMNISESHRLAIKKLKHYV